MATMRAVLIKDGKGPIENLYIGEIERPTPAHGEVLVKVSNFKLVMCYELYVINVHVFPRSRLSG